MYRSEPKLNATELSVFEDLQLLNFIPQAVAKSMKIPCEPDNIEARQALFLALSEENAREKFRSLLEIAQDLKLYDGIYSSPRCDEERNAAFLSLMQSEREFASKASRASFGDSLSVRFSNAFSKELEGEKYKAMSNELDRLCPMLEKSLSVLFKIHGQETKIGGEGEETYISKIEKCAEKLGIDIPSVASTEPRRLSPDIIKSIASQNKELFSYLSDFHGKYSELYFRQITFYYKELRFYLTVCDFTDRIKKAGIPLTYPKMKEGRGISVKDAYDVSLLAKNVTNIIPNDIEFSEDEPFFYLTGANGGGKTTYLRTVGISALMFINGCPIPAREAEFGNLSGVFTHFPRDERFDGSGRFVEENGRVQRILDSMDGFSLVLLNETYSTTNEENAVAMTEKLANSLYEKKIFGLYITHQHSLAESDIPYLNVLIDRDDSNRRTFKIAKQKSTGGSFARDILIRYGLTPEALAERFGSPD